MKVPGRAPGTPSPHGRRRALLDRRQALLALAFAANTARAADANPAGAQRHPWPRGRATPALSLPRLDGSVFKLADARGQVVALNFWASWCEPCLAELPTLETLAQLYGGDGLQVLGVNHREGESTIRRFVQRSGNTLTMLRDADGDAARAWQVRVFPTTIVIGRDGRAAFAVVGELDWTGAHARQWLEPLLMQRR